MLAPVMLMMPPVFLTPEYSPENIPIYDRSLARGNVEHLLTNEQYVDGAKVEFVEVGQSCMAFSSRVLSSIEL